MNPFPITTPAAGVDPSSAPAPEAERRGRLREAAEAFESILLQYVFRKMREAQLEEGFFGKSSGASIQESMFETRLTQRLAQGSPLGLAASLERQWLGETLDATDVASITREANRAHALRALEQTLATPTAQPGTPAVGARSGMESLKFPEAGPIRSTEGPSKAPFEEKDRENQ
ncbi:MAG: hypothetical protein GY716_08450 [bacterium]|nr:hypothetical protein [bacterium]